jgi:flagellar basal-body rod protein FlgC
MDLISSNIANINTTKSEDGEPYRRKMPVFAAKLQEEISKLNKNNNSVGSGVQVVAIEDSKEPFKLMYNPNHPEADQNGYVKMPNINIVSEMTDMISATRAYEANVTAMNSAKAMAQSALKIGS